MYAIMFMLMLMFMFKFKFKFLCLSTRLNLHLHDAICFLMYNMDEGCTHSCRNLCSEKVIEFGHIWICSGSHCGQIGTIQKISASSCYLKHVKKQQLQQPLLQKRKNKPMQQHMENTIICWHHVCWQVCQMPSIIYIRFDLINLDNENAY